MKFTMILAGALCMAMLLAVIERAHGSPPEDFYASLDNSMRPARGDECAQEHPARGRPTFTISYQDRADEPWFYRTCVWHAAAERGKP